MSSIRLVDVAKRWGEAVALERINLDIAAGSFCVLLGPSGCGKSTTLRIIAGMETATEGRVLIDGRDVTAGPPADASGTAGACCMASGRTRRPSGSTTAATAPSRWPAISCW